MCVVGMGMIFVAMVLPVRLELRALGAVALVNVLLGGLFWLVLSHANVLALKLVVTAIVMAVYLRWLAAWGAFDETDRALLAALEEGAPRSLRPLFRLVRGSLGVAAA
jgi:fatty acid desaturase